MMMLQIKCSSRFFRRPLPSHKYVLKQWSKAIWHVTCNIFHPDKPLSEAEYFHSKKIQTHEGKMEIRVLYEMSQRICHGGGNGQCSLSEAESGEN